MLSVSYTNQFKKDIKLVKKRHLDAEKLKEIISLLMNKQDLPLKNKDHQLKGSLKDFRECHIEPDWLLMYRVKQDELILVRTGSHSDLFH